MSMIIVSCESFSTCEQYTENTMIDENSTHVTQTVKLPNHEEINISISVNYKSGLNIFSDDHYQLSMFQPTICSYTLVMQIQRCLM